MPPKISVVVNTLNEEKTLTRLLDSIKWAQEIIICDMHSQDKGVEIAKSRGAKVVFHKKEEYVELARNFAISKASNDWILVLDPDEEMTENLSSRLREIAKSMSQISYVRIPRKNIIFNKWMKASMWWPDYNIRFFKKGKIKWTDKIHRPPEVSGEGLDLPAEEKWAIIHHHYESIPQYLERMIRYTKIQADELVKEGYIFHWTDLIKKPLEEFLSRFFANRGFEDGLHGLSLSLLQAFSQLILYLRLWEQTKFKEVKLELSEVKQISKQAEDEINYWLKYSTLSQNFFKRFFQKIQNKL